MQSPTMSVQLGLGIFFLAIILYTLYKLCKPHPLPGIPYHEQSAKNLFGDLPALIVHKATTGRLWNWMVAQNVALNSPIVQIFPEPFRKPFVIITDFREAQDILMRRTKEFDRSPHFSNVFKGMVPDHHITMQSDDPRFKVHRKLIQDLMTPAFLNEIAAPRIYTVATSLFTLWDEKIRLVNDSPFSAFDDMYRAALDTIWSVTFPSDPKDGIVAAQIGLLAGTETAAASWVDNQTGAIKFPEVPMTPVQESILTLTESIGVIIKSPGAPVLSYKLLSLLPSMRKATWHKETMIAGQLAEIKNSIVQDPEKPADDKCAMEFILRREGAAAARENRQPIYESRMIYDELFGLLVAGHDTTSTTLLWGLKYLSDSPAVQRKLQAALHDTFQAASQEKRPPTVQEIVRAHIPYLDATQEEIIRTSLTAEMVTRVATKDAVVLGARIPKGTSLFFIMSGPGYVAPQAGEIAEYQRSESCQAAKARVGSWDPNDMHLFRPERWLVEEDGKTVFSSTAGPHLAFGLGPRGCFGKRLAYLQIKILLVLLLWKFKLKPVPENLGGFVPVEKLTRQPERCYVSLEKV